MSRNTQSKKVFGNLLIIQIVVILLFIILGAFVFSIVEEHPFFDSLYFSITTLATVGFGDITPHTVLGKSLVMIYSLMGVPLFVSMSGVILENRFNRSVKYQMGKFYKEVQQAERQIQEMEDRVSDEISDVIKDAVNTSDRIDDTQEQVRKTAKEVQQIEKVIKEETLQDNTSRWKKFIKK